MFIISIISYTYNIIIFITQVLIINKKIILIYNNKYTVYTEICSKQ